MKVLAEGVEEERQLSLLQDWSCDQIQGFLFSRLMSEAAAFESIASGDLQDSGYTNKAA